MEADPFDADAAVVAWRAADYMEADILVRVLRDEGVPAALVNDSPSAGITGTMTLGDGLDSAPWAQFAIITTAEHAERARQVIAEWNAARPLSTADEEEGSAPH